MKKKIYFSISAIIQIIISICILVNVKTLVQTELSTFSQTYATFPVSYQERMHTLLEKNGVLYYSILLSLPIIFNIIILINTFKNNILKKKGLLICLSVANLFFSDNLIIILLSLLNIFVLLFLKRKKPEDYPEKKDKSIPVIEYIKSSKKEIVLAILLIIFYFAQNLLSYILPDNTSKNTVQFIVLGYYLISIIIAIFIFKNKLLHDLKLFKENYKKYISFIIPKLILTFIIFIIVSIICTFITHNSTSVNQSALESLPLWFSTIGALIYAPIVEELVFRGCIRRFIKNDFVFIIVSAIIFGLIHTLNEANILNTIVIALPYSVLGGLFAYLYAKSNNLTTNMLTHFTWNLFSTIMTTVFLYVATYIF